jgi:two-component system response regulator
MMKKGGILLVEDNPDHADLTQRVLQDGNGVCAIHWVKNGQEALDFIFRKGVYGEAPRPGLILLDIKLPKLSGVEVLKKIKKDPQMRVIPVIMLTTSDHDEEVFACYALGANSFVTKPVNFRDFSEKVKSLKFYWLLTDHGIEVKP